MSNRSAFSAGDRVLAPWEPQWLYPGTIDRIEGPRARILFDDGDQTTVPLSELRSLVVTVGDAVQACPDRTRKAYLPAEVVAVNGESLRVRYADGGLDALTLGYVRVPNRRVVTQGNRVLAPWEVEWLYPGTVGAIEADQALILFDDGDRIWTPAAGVRPLAVAVGDTVQARPDRTRKVYQTAEVVAVDGENLRVRYADGRSDALSVGYVRLPNPWVAPLLCPGPVAGGPLSKEVEASLNRLVTGLVNREFTFVTPDAAPLREGLAQFDRSRAGLVGKVFGYALGATDAPEFVKTITKHVIGFGAEKVDDEDLAHLHAVMCSCFPLCAFAFSKVWGPRFVAIVDGQDLTQQDLGAALDAFETINHCLMQLGGRLELKLFGKSVLGVEGSSATGSLIVVAPDTDRAEQLRRWAGARPLHSDTVVNQMKESLGRWQFWVKATFGFVEYKPHQLRQEAIVLDAGTGRATSTASPRVGFEFGFSLGDVSTG